MRHRRRARTKMEAIDQINVTPLLDLVFLLLIAFMITMPLMEYGTGVKTPEMNSGSLPQENIVVVELTKDGSYMLEQQVITEDDLRARLREMSSRDPKPELLVRGDGENSYKNVIELLALVRNCGFQNATLVTQAESKK